MSNRLALESSPYLRQHADNPVDWYPWGSEALEKARAEDKPVFLSVGYSACHWCHVMAHESFEDDEIARELNEHFVAIKVDREERPDVDAIYMEAVQALTGSGGWPMSAFLTPEAIPFYGGMYFPPRTRSGMPGFLDVLQQISRLWQDRRAEVLDAAEALADALRERPLSGPDGGALDPGVLRRATEALSESFDPRYGGWSDAPKFPQPAVIEFVLRRYAGTGQERLLGMAARTLDGMMRGGIYDQLGGGFHRYSTDERWLVPHFEKMLYDNAQLARVYLHAWQVSANPEYRQVVTGTLDYLVREMLDPEGGFYSAQDADTQGEEGRYYTWTPEEVREAIAGTAAERDETLLLAAYGITERGDFEGRNVLHVGRRATELADSVNLSVPEAVSHLERARDVLLAAREAREKPGVDDKVLAGWNGLALSAFAEAARVLARPDYRAVAERTARFLLDQMRAEDGRMVRVWKDGQSRGTGYLEDQVAVAEGLLELYQTTFDPRWFEEAAALVEHVLARFADKDGGFFDTADDHEQLLLRPKELQDGAIPSGSSVAADVLARLGAYTGDERYTDAARSALTPLRLSLSRHPLGLSRWLSVLDRLLAAPETLAVVGPQAGELLAAVAARYHPNLVIAAATNGAPRGVVLTEGKEVEEGVATAYYCHDYHCERPVTCSTDLDELLSTAGAGSRTG